MDDLKDLMVTSLKSEGESITKLEKADVLELTVKYLKKLKRQNALGLTPSATYAAKFRVGYIHCAQDVSRFMSSMQQAQQQQQQANTVDVHVSTRLLAHLANCCQALETMPASVVSMAMSPPPPPAAAPMMAPAAISPGYPHIPSSAFSPVVAPDRSPLIKDEHFHMDTRGKENQAMDLTSKPQRPSIEASTRSKDDPSWRPW